MGKTFAKRRLLVGLMTLVLLVSAFLTFNAVRQDPASAEGETAWMSGQGQPVAVGGSGAVRISGAAIIANSTNLLELPNRTGFFQMQVDKSAAWSGIGFLNGLDGWQSVTWPGINTGNDTLPHYIFQDGDAQLHGNTTSAIYGAAAVGINSPKPNFSQALVGVEIHIGTGEDGDVSYIKFNDSMMTQQGTSDQSVLRHMTTADFPNGCYIGMHLNLATDGGNESYFTEIGSQPVVVAMNNVFKDTIRLYEGLPKDEVGISIANLGDVNDLTLKINGTVVDEQYYNITPADQFTNARRIQIRQSFWTSMDFPRESYFTFESTNGAAVLLLDIMQVIPPEWTTPTYTELTALGDVSFDFTYQTATPPTAETISVYSGVTSTSVDFDAPLTPTEDYLLTDNGDNSYTLTITRAYLAEAMANYYGRTFTMQIGQNSISTSIYLIPDQEGWTARPVDLSGEAERDDYYVSLDLVRFNEADMVPRVFYNEGLDVTKPIVMEVDFSTNAFDSSAVWVMLQVMDDYSIMDYFSDRTAATSQLTSIFFGGRTDLQKLGGFIIGENESTNANYTKTSMKKTVIEIYFGADESETGYFRVNGVDCGIPAAKQSDFANGRAYIGWFIPRSANDTVFRINANVNPVTVAAPVQDSAYTMDLSAATDFTLTLQGAGSALTVTDGRGVTLNAGTDYTYDQASSQLVIKADYFSGLPFAKAGTLSIWDNDSSTGTQIAMTYTASAMQESAISFATLGAIADAVVEMPDSVTGILSFMVGEEELTAEQWSFADGSLTIAAAAIPDVRGATEFIVTGSDNLFYPVYVYVDAFENGGVKLSGEGSFETDGSNFILSGDVAYELMQAVNFNAGVTFKVDFKSTPGYYQGGLDPNAGSVTLEFYDPYSGLTFVYRLFTNYAEGSVTASNTALYESYEVLDAEGATVVLESVRAINVANAENPNALGVHRITFQVNRGVLTVTVDNARSTTISDLGGFNLSGSICTVITPAGSEENAMQAGVNCLAGIQEITYDPVEIGGDEPGPGPDDPEEPVRRTCNTNSLMGGVGLSLAVMALLLKRRK